jgi:signal transduction histidine kinase
MALSETDRAKTESRQRFSLATLKARMSGLQFKLIVPYVLLTLIIAAIGIFVITRLVTSTIVERFVNQLYESARVASDAIVRHERTALEILRQATYTIGVEEAILAKDSARLEELLTPLAAVRGDIDSITVIDENGVELLTLGKDPSTLQLINSRGVDFSSLELTQKILTGISDRRGDKYVGLATTSYGPTLLTGAPVYSTDDKTVIGGVIVGTQLQKLLNEIKARELALADLVVFDIDRQNILATTLASPDEGFDTLINRVQQLSQADLDQPLKFKLYNRDFQMALTELIVRQERVGWLGIILPSSYVVAAEATSRDIFVMVFALGTLAMVVVGYLISQSIAQPILKLRSLTQAVAAGDLNQSSGLNRADEIGELAEAFDIMTLKLRERTAEAARLYEEAIQRNKELAETNERLRTTQLQLIQSEKLAAIGQLTAGIVHDVKNPLTVIKGVAELLLYEDQLNSEIKSELSLIRESALKANTIVSDLLKFSRQSKPEMGEQDMRETIEAALRLTAYPIRKAHVQVIKELPEHSVVMTYDAQQIEQVLVNIISNAVQAMPGGGTLRVNLSQMDGMVVIAIQDTGTGISPEHLTRIFDPFFTTKPEGEGTGLGLSVSYGIVSNHSGRIEVDSEVGKGSTFRVYLPMRHPELAEVQT